MTLRRDKAVHALGFVALVAASVLATLAALEVGLRAMEPVRPPAPVPASPPPGLRELRTVIDFATPNTQGVMAVGVLFRTNSSGVQGAGHVLPQPPRTF